jgi:hypothetical protein
MGPEPRDLAADALLGKRQAIVNDELHPVGEGLKGSAAFRHRQLVRWHVLLDDLSHLMSGSLCDGWPR